VSIDKPRHYVPARYVDDRRAGGRSEGLTLDLRYLTVADNEGRVRSDRPVRSISQVRVPQHDNGWGLL
jgi:hypothetical protein